MNETEEFEDIYDPMSEIHHKIIFTILFLLVFIVAFFGNKIFNSFLISLFKLLKLYRKSFCLDFIRKM